jgi:hypothetical protein
MQNITKAISSLLLGVFLLGCFSKVDLRQGKKSSSCPQFSNELCGVLNVLSNGILGVFPGVTKINSGAKLTTSFRPVPKVKNAWSYTSTLPPLYGMTFTLSAVQNNKPNGVTALTLPVHLTPFHIQK